MKNKLKTSYDWGFAYAKWNVENNGESPRNVDIDTELGHSTSIPSDDYVQMKQAGIISDERKYWEGYNAYMQSKQ